jgi:hypothetical protein
MLAKADDLGAGMLLADCDGEQALGVGFGTDAIGFFGAVVTFAIVIGTLDLGVGIAGERARLPGAACDPGRLQPR